MLESELGPYMDGWCRLEAVPRISDNESIVAPHGHMIDLSAEKGEDCTRKLIPQACVVSVLLEIHLASAIRQETSRRLTDCPEPTSW